MSRGKSLGSQAAKSPDITDARLKGLFQNFGRNMKSIRKEMGLTGKTFAGYVGLSTAYVGLLERGERLPSLESFLKICDFCGRSPDEMVQLGIHEPQTNKVAKESDTPLQRKQAMLASITKSFDLDEISYMIEVAKGFNELILRKQGK